MRKEGRMVEGEGDEEDIFEKNSIRAVSMCVCVASSLSCSQFAITCVCVVYA